MSLIVNKEVPFRGQPEVFSNRYNFQVGTNPIDAAFVESVYNAVRDMEKNIHSNRVKFIGGWGGPQGLPAVFSKTESGVPILGAGVDTEQPHPEVCVMAESKLRNRVYLRKFFHTCAHSADVDGDQLPTGSQTAVNNQILKLTDGSLPGGIKACFPNGALAIAPFTADPYLRTRQFKRRGRRPTPVTP